MGATAEGEENKSSAIKNSAANRFIERQGRSREELNFKPGQRITEGEAASALRTLNEEKADTKSETAFTRSLALPTKA